MFKIKLQIIVSTIISMFILPQIVLALGLVTQPINVNDVLRGQVIKENLKLHNDKDNEIFFNLGVEGGISGWVSYYNLNNPEETIDKISVPAKNWAEAGVTIKVPDDTPNGEYQGLLTAMYSPDLEKKENESVATVAQRFKREVKITVTDKEIILFTTDISPEKYAVRENELLNIRATYSNKGNISIKPQVQIRVTEFKGQKKEIFNAIYPYPENEEAVKPLETKTITIPFNTAGLAKEQYEVTATISLNGQQWHEDSFVFLINEDGQVLGSSENIIDKIKNKWYLAVAIIFVVLLLVITVLKSGWLIKKAKA